jgi:hypothetical protein
MSSSVAIDILFHSILREYEGHVYASVAYNQRARYPLPDPSSDIMPMSNNRWAKGKGQHTMEIFSRHEACAKTCFLSVDREVPPIMVRSPDLW